MEITSFVLGMLTIMGVAVAVLVVLGMFKISQQKETINHLKRSIEVVQDNSDHWVRSLEEQMCRNFDEIRREYSSYVDSRADKLQSRIDKLEKHLPQQYFGN